MPRNGEETREKILSVSLHLLQDRGDVRMSDIAKEVGISRQALYLHFPTRAELLIATTRHLDTLNDTDALLVESRAAVGEARLVAFIKAWGNYIPKVYGVARALMAMQATDDAAQEAVEERMQAVRHGCAAAVKALSDAGCLLPDLDEEDATDLLWGLLSIRFWEQMRHDAGWSQEQYLERMTKTAQRALVHNKT